MRPCYAAMLLAGMLVRASGVLAHESPSSFDAMARHDVAFQRSEFWEKVSCVSIIVDVSLKEDKAVAREIEEATSTRLMTVWRREMPDVRVGRGRSSRAMLENSTRKDADCSDGGTRWNPTLQIRVLAGPQRGGNRYYGSVTPSFELYFWDRALNEGANCNGATPCLDGPTAITPDFKHPHLKKTKAMINFWVVKPFLAYGESRQIIVTGSSKEELTSDATECGEEIIHKIAADYYESKSYRKDWERRQPGSADQKR